MRHQPVPGLPGRRRGAWFATPPGYPFVLDRPLRALRRLAERRGRSMPFRVSFNRPRLLVPALLGGGAATTAVPVAMPASTSPSGQASHAADSSRPRSDLRSAPSPAPSAGRAPRSRSDDWMTAAVVFAILGGCVALWLADLSLVVGSLAAVVSGIVGVLFADA